MLGKNLGVEVHKEKIRLLRSQLSEVQGLLDKLPRDDRKDTGIIALEVGINLGRMITALYEAVVELNSAVNDLRKAVGFVNAIGKEVGDTEH